MRILISLVALVFSSTLHAAGGTVVDINKNKKAANAGAATAPAASVPASKAAVAMKHEPAPQTRCEDVVLDGFEEGLEEEMTPEGREKLAKTAVTAYASLARKKGRTITLEELEEAYRNAHKDLSQIIGPGKIFQDLATLKERVKEDRPEVFEKIVDEEEFNLVKAQDAANAFMRKNRVLVTSVFSGSPVNKGMFKALIQLAKEKDAEIIVVPLNGATGDLDRTLFEDHGVKIHILLDGIKVNRWLQLVQLDAIGKIMNPTASLNPLWYQGTTSIIPAPRLNVLTVANNDNMLRNTQFFTTGVLNDSNIYRSPKFIGRRTDNIAERLHKMGALLLERADGRGVMAGGDAIGQWHPRQLEYIDGKQLGETPWKPEEQGIYDDGKLYASDGKVYPVRPEAVVFPDVHVAQLDPKAIAPIIDMIKKLRPKRVILHDLFDGFSISHHDAQRIFKIIKKIRNGELNLAKELSAVARFINELLKADPDLQIVIVKSNHDQWLYRWIQDGEEYKKPGPNADIAASLSHVIAEGDVAYDVNGQALGFMKDPFQFALLNGVRNDKLSGKRGSVTVSDAGRVLFYEQGRSFKVGTEEHPAFLVELGNHGDIGPNGSRSTNPKTMGTGAGPSIAGHVHNRQWRDHNGLYIGSFLYPRVEYNSGGASTWGVSIAQASPYGHREVYQLAAGQYYMEDPNSPNLQNNVFWGGDSKPEVNPNLGRALPATAAGYDAWTAWDMESALGIGVD